MLEQMVATVFGVGSFGYEIFHHLLLQSLCILGVMLDLVLPRGEKSAYDFR